MSARYPIGKCNLPASIDAGVRQGWIAEIEAAPDLIRAAVAGAGAEQLETPYREGGWTVRQVVHHVADSHMNAYIRTRLALTEDHPTIKPYDEQKWATLVDAKTGDPQVSLVLLEAMHRRWVALLKSLSEADFARKLIHPEHGELDLNWILGAYAWHGKHHAAQIRLVTEASPPIHNS